MNGANFQIQKELVDLTNLVSVMFEKQDKPAIEQHTTILGGSKTLCCADPLLFCYLVLLGTSSQSFVCQHLLSIFKAFNRDIVSSYSPDKRLSTLKQAFDNQFFRDIFFKIVSTHLHYKDNNIFRYNFEGHWKTKDVDNNGKTIDDYYLEIITGMFNASKTISTTGMFPVTKPADAIEQPTLETGDLFNFRNKPI